MSSTECLANILNNLKIIPNGKRVGMKDPKYFESTNVVVNIRVLV